MDCRVAGHLGTYYNRAICIGLHVTPLQDMRGDNILYRNWDIRSRDNPVIDDP